MKENKYWIARDKDRRLFLYYKFKPYKECDEWLYHNDGSVPTGGDYALKITESDNGMCFLDIHWEDKEPTPVYVGNTGRAEIIKEIGNSLGSLTKEEQEALLELLDKLKKEYNG